MRIGNAQRNVPETTSTEPLRLKVCGKFGRWSIDWLLLMDCNQVLDAFLNSDV